MSQGWNLHIKNYDSDESSASISPSQSERNLGEPVGAEMLIDLSDSSVAEVSNVREEPVSSGSLSNESASKPSIPINCAAITVKGLPCKLRALPTSPYCTKHKNYSDSCASKETSTYPAEYEIKVLPPGSHNKQFQLQISKLQEYSQNWFQAQGPCEETRHNHNGTIKFLNKQLMKRTFVAQATLPDLVARATKIKPVLRKLNYHMSTNEVRSSDFTRLESGATVLTSDGHVLIQVFDNAMDAIFYDEATKTKGVAKLKGSPAKIHVIREATLGFLDGLNHWPEGDLPKPRYDIRHDAGYPFEGGVLHQGICVAQGNYFAEETYANAIPSSDISGGYCLNAFNHMNEKMAPLVQGMNKLHQAIDPEGYATDIRIVDHYKQGTFLKALAENKTRQTKTIFAATVSVDCTCHLDSGDDNDTHALSGMCCLGDFTGGLLVFPGIRCYVEYKPGTVVFIRPYLLDHLITEIGPPEDFENSYVFDKILKMNHEKEEVRRKFPQRTQHKPWTVPESAFQNHGFRIGLVFYNEYEVANHVRNLDKKQRNWHK